MPETQAEITAKPLPRILVESLTGCAGELLVILENLDKLLPFVKVVHFPFAQSKNEVKNIDIAFVEGSVSQPHDIEKLKNIRDNSRCLVAVGNCAVWGCVQGSSCERCNVQDMLHKVYGADSKIAVLKARPIEEVVKVEARLSGCPISATQFLAVTASLLKNHLPYVTHKPVCLECKLKENPCVLIEKNLPCLGPVTAAGCGALCPSVGAACYGCWGPCQSPQMEAMGTILQEKGYELSEVLNRLQTFGAPAELFSRMQKLPEA